jgi:hypothetical protein
MEAGHDPGPLHSRAQSRGREGDTFIGPHVQREEIQHWATGRGVEIAAWHEDVDQSGGKLARPGLDAIGFREPAPPMPCGS